MHMLCAGTCLLEVVRCLMVTAVGQSTRQLAQCAGWLLRYAVLQLSPAPPHPPLTRVASSWPSLKGPTGPSSSTLSQRGLSTTTPLRGSGNSLGTSKVWRGRPYTEPARLERTSAKPVAFGCGTTAHGGAGGPASGVGGWVWVGVGR
jgi:hypothetical protein